MPKYRLNQLVVCSCYPSEIVRITAYKKKYRGGYTYDVELLDKTHTCHDLVDDSIAIPSEDELRTAYFSYRQNYRRSIDILTSEIEELQQRRRDLKSNPYFRLKRMKHHIDESNRLADLKDVIQPKGLGSLFDP